MAINLNDIANKTMRLMQGSGHRMRMFDAGSGKSVATPDEARFFYVKDPNMMVHIDDNTNELKFHIGEDVDIDNPDINNMMNQLKSLARTNMLDFDIRSFGKHIEPKNYAYKVKQNQENTMTDHVNEGMGPLSGSSRTSRQTLENVRIILKHRAPVNEESRGSRSRNITSIFVESGEGERFKYPFIHLNGARAMARHVASGGVPHDMVGEAIVELSDNLSRLKEFMGVVNRQKLVNETNRSDVWNVKRSMDSIKETVQRIQGAKGYASFVEGIALSDHKPQEEISEETVDAFVQKFTKSTFEESLRDIFPLLHKVNEEELENRRTNQVDRVKEIISAREKKTDEIINKISFGGPRDGYDYEQIKKQYIEPRTPEEATQKKIDMIAMTFDDLADRVDVDTLDDKTTKKKGHDRAAELSFFLTDIANDIRKNPRGVDKEELKVAGHLLKMSKASVETVEPTSADENWNMMVESAFSKFDPDSVIQESQPSIKEEVQKINEMRWIGWQIFRWGDYWGKNTTLHTELKYNGKHAYWLDSTDREYIEKIKNKLGKAISSGEHPHIRNWTGDHDDGSLDNPNQNIYKFDPEDMTPEERKDYELDKTEREEGFGSGPPRATVRDLSKAQKAELYNEEEEELEFESINRLSKLAGV